MSGLGLPTLNAFAPVAVSSRATRAPQPGRSADVLWSPAMDLQMKLVNDGRAHMLSRRRIAEETAGETVP